MTECIQEVFGFAALGPRQVVARFDGDHVTSEGGALLLRQVDCKIDLLARFAQCFTDQRDPARTTHAVEQLLRQRIYALELGYKDLHDCLRYDSLFGLLASKDDPGAEQPAGKSTLNRLELTRPLADRAPQRYNKIVFDPESADQLLVQLFLEAHPSPPTEIVLDRDATDDPRMASKKAAFSTATLTPTATSESLRDDGRTPLSISYYGIGAICGGRASR